MALELFVQLLEICGINMNFSSLIQLFLQIAYHSLQITESQRLREYDHEPGKSARKLRSTREFGS